MKDSQYVVIQAFMVNDLHLKGNELIVYATIYGFTQDGEHWFYGTKGYLAEWCGATKNTVGNCLRSLTEMGLLERRERIEHGQVKVEYRATKNVGTPYKNCDTPHTNFVPFNKIDEQPKEESKDIPYEEIICYLNEKAGTRYRASTPKTQQLIRARWSEGFRLGDFKAAIDAKCAEWLRTDMEKYLRPETLFGTKMEGYANQRKGARDVPECLQDYDF